MQATNSLDFYVQRKRSIKSKPVGKAPKPPKLDQALKLVADKLAPYALTLTNDLSNAEDLCQQTLIKLIENQQKFLNAEYPYAYAKKILKNAFIDSLRKQKNNISLDDVGQELSINGNQVAQLEHRDLMKCLKRHSETDQIILSMLGAGHSYADIQRFIGKISIENLRIKALRARKTLAECLGRNK